MNKYYSIISLIFLLFFNPSELSAQVDWSAPDYSVKNYPVADSLRSEVEYLASWKLQGRESCTRGAELTVRFLEKSFGDCGILPLTDNYRQDFYMSDYRRQGCNVVGLWSGFDNYPVHRYVVVGAHYDSYGRINGMLYPGADSNASGVVAMMSVARWIAGQKHNLNFYPTSIIFVAFDGFIDKRSGSRAFLKDLSEGRFRDPVSDAVIDQSAIAMMIDLDQIGSSLVPLKSGREDYLMAIAEPFSPSDEKGLLERCNDFYGTGLELCRSYYGNGMLSRAMLRFGDRRCFVDAGVPVMWFTSGVTDNNNSPRDMPETLNYEVFRRRVILISRFIEKLLVSSSLR